MSFQGASSCFTRQSTNDVCLSFRGKDTGTNFTTYLYTALCQQGIRTFMDDDFLLSGEKISLAFLKAVEASEISIIVFSKNYPSSRFCLDELMIILELRKTKKQQVLPVFYDVDPYKVPDQTNSVGKAFAELEEKFKDDKMKVEGWRAALTEIAEFGISFNVKVTH
jgi:hypothetical protein